MKIGQRLSLGFVGVTLLIAVVGVVAVYYQHKIIEQDAINEIRAVERNFLNLKERDTEILSSALEVFVQNQAFKDVYLEKDRVKLYNYGQPLFQNLKNKYGITHFYFILPDGYCFLRLHDKDIYGDLITRFTFWKARDTEEAASGIELGKTAFALRVVMPYYNGNELIGYVEFGEEINHFLEILKGKTNNEFTIIADKKHLDREKWKSVTQVAGLRDNWDDLEEHLIISDTTEGKMEAAGKFFTEENLERIEEGETVLERMQSEDKTFAGGGFEIIDAGGRHAGAILSLINITDQLGIAQKAEFTTIGAIIILLITALSISFFFSRSISIPITKLKSAVLEIGKGKLDAKVVIKSKDEIGELSAFFNKMLEDLKISRDELVTAKDYIDNILKSMIDTLVVVDPEGKIKTINKATTELLGYREEELIGQPAEKILAEETIEETTEEDLLNEIDDGALLISKDFKILKANNVFIENTGLKREKIIGQPCYKVTHDRDKRCELPHDKCPLDEAVEKGGPCVELHTHFSKEGKDSFVNVVAAPIRSKKGDIVYYLHLAKQARQDQKESRLTDEELKDIKRLINKLETYVGKLEEARIFSKDAIGRLVESGSIRNLGLYYKTKLGEKIPISFSGSALKDREGNLAGIVGVARDMREIRRLEAQLVKSEKLVAIGKLAAGVAHEINNPLNVISGHAEMLSMEKSKDENAKRVAGIIMEQTKRATTIIQSLLHFSRQIKLKMGPVDVNKTLEETLPLLTYQVEVENINIVRELTSDLPKIIANSGQLQQVFLNIMLNAVQAMPNGGALTIRTYAAEATEFGRRKADIFKRGDKIVVIEFRDTGNGIPEEELERVFDPFFSTKEGGTGLGLSICHGIIDAHQGMIEVKSKKGEGASFIIKLPA